MHVRNNEYSNEGEDNFELAGRPVTQEKNAPKPKFNASFEKKIEQLWFESDRLGWSYNDFVIHMLEVLVILRHRQSVRRAAAPERRAAA
jgi:hypothetical protein